MESIHLIPGLHQTGIWEYENCIWTEFGSAWKYVHSIYNLKTHLIAQRCLEEWVVVHRNNCNFLIFITSNTADFILLGGYHFTHSNWVLGYTMCRDTCSSRNESICPTMSMMICACAAGQAWCLLFCYFFDVIIDFQRTFYIEFAHVYWEDTRLCTHGKKSTLRRYMTFHTWEEKCTEKIQDWNFVMNVIATFVWKFHRPLQFGHSYPKQNQLYTSHTEHENITWGK